MLPTKAFNTYPIAAVTAEDAVKAVLQSIVYGPPTTYRLVNAGTLDAAAASGEYQSLLRGEGVNLPDGKPLAAVLRLTRPQDQACEQVRGPWLFEQVLDRGRAVSARHFLLGASTQTLADLTAAIGRKFPGAEVVGSYSPPFGARADDELHEADRLVAASGANVVWVAMGTPKQDAEAVRILRSVGLTTLAVGAAFDFTAGTKKTAPAAVRRLGLEWLFRLMSEPRRLWRRYFVGNFRFIGLSVEHFVRRP